MKPARFICWATSRESADCTVTQTPMIAGYCPEKLNFSCNLLVGDDTSCLIDAERRTVLIGAAFDREGRQVDRLNVPIDADTATIADWAFKKFWGSFVIVRGGGCATTIIRDPSATMPCYVLRSNGTIVAGSHIRDMTAAANASPGVDWRRLIRHLRAVQYRDEATSLIGVTELLPGSMLDLDSDVPISHPLWSPWEFARRDRFVEDRQEAVTLLRQTIMLVTRAWGSQFRHGLLSLSGGLDSSILAVGLAQAGVASTAVTMLSGTASGDEERYAATIAAHLGIPLEVRHLLDVSVDVAVSNATHLPRPTARMFWQGADRLLEDVATIRGVDAHFHGGGGDNVFCFLQSVAPILDRIEVDGFGRGAMRTLRDICILTGSDWRDAGTRVLRRWLSGRRSYRWSVDDTFLSTLAKAWAPPDFDHPWLDLPSDGLAGSAAHIALLLAIQNYLEGYRRELTAPVIAPLLSQPLVEMCLRIPSWMWCQGGRNRSVARDAVADLLPPEILARRSKGTPDGYSMAIYEAQRLRIRDFLRNGALAGQGLLDLAAIDRIVTREGPVCGFGYARILSLCDVEAWVQSWL